MNPLASDSYETYQTKQVRLYRPV